MTYKPKVYTASTLSRLPLWLSLREDPDWEFVQWTASWPLALKGRGETKDQAELRAAWSLNIYEIRHSDFVLLYGRDQGLRGALVECGAALAYGIRVITVGLHEEHTWSFHPQVTRCYNLDLARNFLRQYTIMVPPKSHKEPRNDQV